MIKALRLLLGLAGLIVIIAFAIANRTPVAISFAPLPIAIELPVYGWAGPPCGWAACAPGGSRGACAARPRCSRTRWRP